MWETPQTSLLCAHSVPYSGPWPTSGVMRAGACYAPATSAPRTEGNASSSPPGAETPLLKTPTSNIASNGGSQHPSKRKAGGHGPNLADEIEWLLPTPKASDGIKGSPRQRHGNGDLTLPSAAAQLNSRATTARVRATPPPTLFDASTLTKRAPGNGDGTATPSPGGRGSPVRHRRRPTTRAVSARGSWSGCKALTTAG
ncbi:hypothetical protein GCM10022420_070760 [Streptomyces iranensis]